MISPQLLQGAVAIAAIVAYRKRTTEPRAVTRTLATIAIAFVTVKALQWAAGHVPAGPSVLALQITAAAACIPLLAGLVSFELRDVRGRAWSANAAFGVLALLFATRGGLLGALIGALLALARWHRGGLRGLPNTDWPRPAVRWAILAAVAIVTLEISLGRIARAPLADATLDHFVRWTVAITVIRTLVALPSLVRQATLGVRRVSRRLTLLFMLSAFIPLLLTATLWALTTWLGVGSERALIAARALHDESRLLQLELRHSRATDPSLSSFARLIEARWPGGGVWSRPHTPRAGSGAAAAWTLARGNSVLDSVPLATLHPGDSTWVVVTHTRAFLAALDTTERDGDVFVLVPAAPIVSGRLASLVGARLTLESRFGSSDSTGTGARRGSTPRYSVTTGRDSTKRLTVVATPSTGPLSGLATIPARVWTPRGWDDRLVLLSAIVEPIPVATGLFREVRENPFAVLPIAILAATLLVFVFVLVFDFGMIRDLGRTIAGTVATLRAGTAALEGGDLSHRIEERGHDDLGELAGSFNRMAEGLERAREAELGRRKLEDELALARRIQARLLPGPPPELAGVQIAGLSQSALQVGGDYYDHLLLDDGRVALVVADVSGKGVPAALLMSGFRAAVMSQRIERESPAEVFSRINTFLYRSVEPGRFVTAFLAYLDPATGAVVYCNAGHNAPIVVGRDGSVARLEAGGLVLGMLEHSPYETGAHVLQSGDLLTLFTDGVTEAQNPAGDLWDEPPLVALLQKGRGVPLADLASAIVAALRAFEAGRPASDDVTLLLARRAEPSNPLARPPGLG